MLPFRTLVRMRALLVCAFAAVSIVPPVHAEPVVDQLTLVVGFPPGGASDLVARLVAKGLQGSYAKNVIVDNRPGAAGRLAAEYVKGRPADGRWMLFTPTFPMNIHPHIYDNVRYDTLKDFTPVAPVSFNVLAISAGPSVPEEIASIEQLVTWLRDNPDKAVYGAPPGSSQHFSAVKLAKAIGVDLSLVGYQGGAPSLVDVMGGHIPLVVTALPEALPHVQSDKLRILALTARERVPQLPDVPTLYESGYPTVVTQDWMGFLAPAGLPQDILERANKAITEAVMSPEVQEGLERLGSFAYTDTPEGFKQVVHDSWMQYRDVIRESGFRADAQ